MDVTRRQFLKVFAGTAAGVAVAAATGRAFFDVGASWARHGELWLDRQLEQVFRYGSNEKIMLVGSGAPEALEKLTRGQYARLVDAEYPMGIPVKRLLSRYGELVCLPHPLVRENQGLICHTELPRSEHLLDMRVWGNRVESTISWGAA